jgi:hypothetical protein
MPVYDWSQTANANASADPTINYEIGMAPSAVGSSGRAVMAAYCGTLGAIEGGIRFRYSTLRAWDAKDVASKRSAN